MDAGDWDRRYAEAEFVWGTEPNRWVAGEVAPLSPGTALDLAAGEGRNAAWLAGRGWDVTAVDFSAEGLAKLDRRAGAAGVTVATVCADVLDYHPARTYDLVMAVYLQLPADQRRRVHANAAACLAPGGTLLVIAHDATNLTDGYGGPPMAEVLFSPEDVIADVAGAGLVIDKAERVLRPVKTPEGQRTAIDALFRAHQPA